MITKVHHWILYLASTIQSTSVQLTSTTVILRAHASPRMPIKICLYLCQYTHINKEVLNLFSWNLYWGILCKQSKCFTCYLLVDLAVFNNHSTWNLCAYLCIWPVSFLQCEQFVISLLAVLLLGYGQNTNYPEHQISIFGTMAPGHW